MIFQTAFAAVVRLLKRTAQPSLACPECETQGALVWFCRVRCPACGCEWRWHKADGNRWLRDITRHGCVVAIREGGAV